MKTLSDVSLPVHFYVGNELFTHVTADTFGDMIDRFMGYEAAEFYRELLAETSKTCAECDAVYKTQEHYQRVISEALEILDDVEVKKAFETKFKKAYDKLYSEAG